MKKAIGLYQSPFLWNKNKNLKVFFNSQAIMPDIKKISYEIKNYKFIFKIWIYTIRYFYFCQKYNRLLRYRDYCAIVYLEIKISPKERQLLQAYESYFKSVIPIRNNHQHYIILSKSDLSSFQDFPGILY